MYLGQSDDAGNAGHLSRLSLVPPAGGHIDQPIIQRRTDARAPVIGALLLLVWWCDLLVGCMGIKAGRRRIRSDHIFG